MTSRERWLTVLGGVLVFAVTAAYRFCLLGGQLGGFENDEYLVISRAAAMLRGELPSRDFVDPGYPLAYMASALSMQATGGTLLGHALLTVLMLAFGAVLTYAVAVRASGSRMVGILIALVQLGLGPRLYNYPKIVLYALAVLGWWWYIDRRTRTRLGALAVLTAVAFLFRHDHGIYIAGGTAVMLIVLAREAGLWPTLTAALGYGAATAACLLPYLVFLEVHGGIREHVRTGTEFSRVDRDRTHLRWPTFALDFTAHAVEFGPRPEVPRARIKVRWREPGPTLGEVAAFAESHGLRPHGSMGTDGAEFEVRNESPENLRALARDPLVADTQNIDRTAWRVRERPPLRLWERMQRATPLLRVHLAPGILRAENAAPFVYYVWLVLPGLVALAVLIAVATRGDAAAWGAVYRLAPVVAVMLPLNQWFLRGTLPVRLADVSVLAAALGAWGLSEAVRAARAQTTVVRLACLAGIGVVVLGTMVSAFAVGDVISNLRVMTDGRGPAGVPARAAAVADQLATPGPELAARAARTTPVMRLADYLHACLGPEQRALVVAYLPEVFFFADRGFAGGQVDLRAGYLIPRRDQELVIDRMRRQSVPIVVTEATAVFNERYRPESPLLVAYIDQTYVDTGDRDLGGQVFRILARRDLRVRRAHSVVDAPCFQ